MPLMNSASHARQTSRRWRKQKRPSELSTPQFCPAPGYGLRMDLFEAAAADGKGPGSATAPLAVRMRPRTLDEVVGQDHLLAPGSPLRRLVDGDEGVAGPASVILWGPPGTGKTTLAYLVSAASGRAFV